MRAGPAMGLAVDHGRIGELGEVNSSGEQDQEGHGARRVRCICPLAFAVVLSPSATPRDKKAQAAREAAFGVRETCSVVAQSGRHHSFAR